MSPMEQAVLSQGRIPAPLILSEIRAYVEDNEGNEYLVETLAEKAAVSVATMESWVFGNRPAASMEFDVADRLLCAIGRQQAWHREYASYYHAVNLAIVDRNPPRRAGVPRPDGEVCRNGHERTPENTKQRKDGRRECKTCALESARRVFNRRREELDRIRAERAA